MITKERIGVGVAAALTCVVLLARAGAFAPPSGLSVDGLSVFGLAGVMAALWVGEVLPIAATAFIPLVAFPLLGVAPAKVVAKEYSASIIFLLLGGSMLAQGLERWGVPKVIAAFVQRWSAGSAVRLHYGLMVAACGMSMWLSNTATTLVMVTVVLAAIGQAKAAGAEPKALRNFSLSLLLGLCYAANIGGLGTPVGTAPNALVLGMLDKSGENPFTFLSWMISTAPIILILLPAAGLLLHKVLCPFPDDILGPRTAGPPEPIPHLSTGAKRALAVFAATAVLWMWRKDIDLGLFVIPGWSTLTGLSKLVDDGAVAMFGVIVMCAMPAGEPDEDGRKTRVLNWAWAQRVPWALFILFGGGLALAAGFQSTGLSSWLGGLVAGLGGVHVFFIVLIICIGMSLLTEVTSNTATTTLLLPVLSAAAVSLGVEPLVLMWPAAICASAAFILPISTPPNAIVAGAGELSMSEMARVGVWLNLLCVIVVSLVTHFWVPLIIG